MKTLVKLKISQSAFNEVAFQLREAGHGYLIDRDFIDMTGIAVTPDPDLALPPGIVLVDANDIDRDDFRKLYSIDSINVSTDK